MPAVLFNVLTVLVGSALGLLCRKGIPEKYSDAIMKGIALCTIYIGISGALKGENTIVLIISMVLGAAVGTIIDIDGFLERVGKKLEDKFSKQGGGSIARGFVTASLLFCVGSMTIVGSLTAGLTHDYETLITKSILDLFSSMMLSVSLGIGVMFAAAFVLVFQGALVLLAGLIAPLLSTAATNEIICAGSVIIIGLGLNLIGLTKLKVANYLPAMLFAPLILALVSLIPMLA